MDDRCLIALEGVLKPKGYTPEQIAELLKDTTDRATRKQRNDQFLSRADAMISAAQEIKDEKLANKARIEKQAYLKQTAWKESKGEIDRMMDDYRKLGGSWLPGYDSLRAYFYGRVGPVEGSSQGLFTRTHNLSIGAVGRFMEDQNRVLRENGLSTGLMGTGKKYLADPEVDRRVSIALGYLSNGVDPKDIRVDNAPLSKVDLELAQNLKSHLDQVRAYANDRGSDIGHADHYMGRMVWDPDSITAAGRDKFVTEMKRLLNPDVVESLGDKGLETAFRNLRDGRHLGVAKMDMEAFYNDYNANPGVTTTQNLAAKLSKDKTLLFTSPESAYEARQLFGGGKSVFENTANQVRRTIHDADVIHALGPNPEEMANKLVDYVKDRASNSDSVKDIGTLNSSTLIKNIDSSLRGDRYLVQSAKAADIDAFTRNAMTGLRLGWGWVRQVPDFLFFASAMKAYGGNYFESLGKSLHDFVSMVPDANREEVLYRLWASGIDSGMEVARWGLSHDDLAKGGGKFAQTMMTLSGQSRESRVLFQRAVTDINAALAYHGTMKDTAFNDLPAMMKAKLTKAGLTEPAYDFVRKNLAQDVGQFKILDPTMIERMTDANDPKLREFIGPDLSERQFRVEAQDFAAKLRNYALEGAAEAMNEPTEAMQVFKTMGNAKRGSWAQVLGNQFSQFKSYSASQLIRSLGREMYDTGKINWMGVGGYAMNAIVGGYLVLTLEAWLQGITAPDIKSPKTWIDSAVMGGLAGLFTDSLQNIDQHNIDPVARAITNPVGGTIAQAFNTFIRNPAGHALDGSASSFGKDSFNLGYGLIPGSNLWWTRGAIQMFGKYAAMEKISPGYYARQERNLQKWGQEHFVQPTLALPF